MYAPGVMNASDWAAVSNLLPLDQHNWGDRNKIDRRVIRSVDDLARTLSQKVLITCGTAGEHVKGSSHYPVGEQLGVALDIMFPNIPRRDLPDILFSILRLGFSGIGIYSEWSVGQHASKSGGFHVDFRPVYSKALWLKGTGGYEALNMANIRKYFT